MRGRPGDLQALDVTLWMWKQGLKDRGKLSYSTVVMLGERRPSFLPSQNKAKAGGFLLGEVSSRLDPRDSMDLGGDCTSLTSVT